jgi:hypothetical protein
MIPLFDRNFIQQRDRIADEQGVITLPFYYLILSIYNRTGQQSGIPVQVGTGLIATGTTLVDAFQLSLDFSEVLTTPLNSGVRLANMQPGQFQLVFNGGANPLKIYPQAGDKIDALAVSAAYTLAATKSQMFMQFSLTQVRTLQLG